MQLKISLSVIFLQQAQLRRITTDCYSILYRKIMAYSLWQKRPQGYYNWEGFYSQHEQPSPALH